MFTLAPRPDAVTLKHDFARERFVHIANILELADARRVYETLNSSTPWSLVFNDRGKHIDMPAENLAAMTIDQSRRLQDAIYAQGADGFQYCYNNYPIYDHHVAGQNKDHLLDAFYRWLNTETFLDFARAVTGMDDIAFADAQATRYQPGHFLTTHDDEQPGKNRRAAYVFNFTSDWRADWGGCLQLLDEAGNVRQGLMPCFNALNLLAVPQPHNVSMVAPFCRASRFAITGWLRSR